MNKRMNLTDDTITKPEIFWSEKYACPLYRVGDKTYVGLTGEYGGYFEEVDTQGNDLQPSGFKPSTGHSKAQS